MQQNNTNYSITVSVAVIHSIRTNGNEDRVGNLPWTDIGRSYRKGYPKNGVTRFAHDCPSLYRRKEEL